MVYLMPSSVMNNGDTITIELNNLINPDFTLSGFYDVKGYLMIDRKIEAIY